MNRLEPLAIVILSAIMVVASLQLVREAALKIVGLANQTIELPDVGVLAIVVSLLTICKFLLHV